MLYAFDANAIITLLEDRPGAEQVEQILLQRREGAEFTISAVTWGEVFYSMARKMPFDRLRAALNPLRHAIEIVAADTMMAEHAAELKHSYKLGYGDAFAAALAIQRKAVLVTADPDFANLGKLIKLRMLPNQKRKN